MTHHDFLTVTLNFFEMPSAGVHDAFDVVGVLFVVGPGFPAEDLNRCKMSFCSCLFHCLILDVQKI
jgi:hypothetical protein